MRFPATGALTLLAAVALGAPTETAPDYLSPEQITAEVTAVDVSPTPAEAAPAEENPTLGVGDIAPDFEVPDDQGQPIRLSALLARGPVVLYFYPADFTPLCTREACMFRDTTAELASLGVQIVGVSPQDAESHRRFRAEHQLPFRLLADTGRQVIRAYGLERSGGAGVHRATFFIGRDGRIEDMVRADGRLEPHEALVERVRARFETATEN